MDVTIPPEVDAVLEMMGVHWPNVRVDEIVADRDAWITVLAGSHAAGQAAQTSVQATGEVYKGESATELQGLWNAPAGVGEVMGRATAAVQYVPQVLDNAAWLTTGLKVAVATGAVYTSARIARAMLMGGPTAGPAALWELIRGRILVTKAQHQAAEGVGRVLRPALAHGSTGKFRGVLDDLPRLNTPRGPNLGGPDGPKGGLIAEMGFPRKRNASSKTNSGTRRWDDKDQAVDEAKQDAKDGGRARFRGECSSGDHVHVDYYNKNGEVSHTRHYSWKGAKKNKKP
ncbi:hypothetical protein [Nonomuraea sp. CA-141351]|uniref:hypothetical protein n=1 Tax=Nonomuraea sp. CA-141351 TaxID=3239996 RepID=UPI003D903083